MDIIHEGKNTLIRRFISYSISSILIGTLIWAIMGGLEYSGWKGYIYNVIYSLLIGAVSAGFGPLIRRLNISRGAYLNNLKGAIGVLVLANVLYPLPLLAIVNYLWQSYTNFFGNAATTRTVILIEYGIFIIYSTFYLAKFFLQEWKEAIREQERIKQEAIVLKYNVMQNQVNPHFLFNSLNTMTALVDIDPEKAKAYSNELSTFYRSVIASIDEELRDVNEEMALAKSYINLQQVRFMNNFAVDINLPTFRDREVVPMAIQMLVENAIKHNEVSKSSPLKVRIYNEGDDFIVVENAIKRKQTKGESSRIGLKNISERYSHLTGQKVIVEDDNVRFKVSIPLLQMDAAEVDKVV